MDEALTFEERRRDRMERRAIRRHREEYRAETIRLAIWGVIAMVLGALYGLFLAY